MTLIELLTALAVLAFLLGLGLPGIGHLVAGTQANGAMLQLRGMLALAREEAITRHREITLCGTANGSTCASTWDGMPTLVFSDANLNRQLDTGEDVLTLSELTHSARIRWRASGNRSYLRYRPDGSVGEYGSFTYCPPDADPRHARQIILNATGRPRSAVDRDGDGIVEDPSGNPVRCW
jgi:type IV fimbrial biogenesis protein FimT